MDGSKPRMLAVHELDSAELDPYMLDVLSNTEWAQKIRGTAESHEQGLWEFVGGTGGKEEKL